MTSTPAERTAPPGSAGAPAPMTRREVMESLSGILLGMFVAILASSIVSSSLPKIVSDLDGSQSSYTWVVTSTLLAMTISTPIWGKLADLTNRKVLIQIALVVAVVSSALAGLSQNVGTLIALRAFQGIGAGGLMALATVLITDIISPRERGKFMGLMGGIMAVSQIGGPLLGGVLTDAVSWRLNFFVGLPFAIAAIVVLQRTLHLPKVARRVVRIDYWGAILISAGVSSLLLWVTFAGQNFEWLSWQTFAMVGGAVVALVGAVLVERVTPEPLIPLHLFKNRTFVLAVVASVAVGVAMFGTAVFLSQYMQVARGKTPTESGLLTIPMIVGTFVASTLFGQLITRYGRYKAFMVTGGAVLVASLFALSTIDYHTSFTLISVYLFFLGVSMGMLMQNLVLAVQNTLAVEEMGAGTSTVAFFRSLGGAIGVSVLGAVLANKVTTSIQDGLTQLGVPAGSMGGGNAVPDVSTLPAPIKDLVEKSYGDGIAEIFLVAVPLALVALIAVSFLKEVPLGTKTGLQERLEKEAALLGADAPVDATPGRVTLAEETESTLLGAYEPAGVVDDEATARRSR
ncbi:MAG: MDR family MFS transporter [Cellulosimicrobium funkei]|uniref:MFS transporter n=1 Tax=Cellulosimicrobium cellulans TaxID=1710 RepID=A0AAV5P294_CELCE|nr:MDR family MFS transporter [Cellulosimicrobium cellulans]QDP74721.1 MFS transporter [Cellulosimicrobium cellulans]GLY55975.1 MFS transporter [Cellulosimicrobium cellulans]